MSEESFYNLIYDSNTLSTALLNDIAVVIGIINDLIEFS